MYSMEKLSNKIIKDLDILVAEQQIELWDHLDEKINLDWDAYYNMEDMGIFYLFTVRDVDQLIGYCSFIIAPDPHYKGRITALQDSLFVSKEYRSKGVGEKLIDHCDNVLERDFKVDAIHQGVNVKIDFSSLLERKGYEPTEKILVKRFT